MGVTGLWKLIEQSGKEILTETLENKVIAVDISIWLHQVIKGFQDRRGNALQNAHLLGLFNRLCKLLFYKIKPVFIFDGSVPILKRDTIAKRQQGRTKILKEVERIQELLLEAMNKEKVVRHALDPEVTKNSSPNKGKTKEKKDGTEGIFTIPDYLSPNKVIDDSCQPGSSSDFNTSLSENDSFDDNSLQHYYNINLQSIDVNSSHFKSLPADVRLEILGDIRQMRKQHSWGRLHEMPTESNNFSDFQMKRLLKRRQVQVCLEEAEKELEGRCLTLSELETFLSEQGIVTAEKSAKSRIHSDANTRFLLVKDLKKAIEKAAKLELTKNEPTEEQVTPKEESNLKRDGEISKNVIMSDEVSADSLDIHNEIDENEADMQLAIELSLNQTNTYNDNDYIASKACLNKEQKNMFRNATGSARDYLLKYGLIKNLDLDQLDESQNEKAEKSQLLDDLKHNRSLMAEIIGVKSSKDIHCIREKETNGTYEKLDDNKVDEIVAIISDDSDSDVDFIEVDEPSNIFKNNFEKIDKIQIHVDASKPIKPAEDIFADIFKEKHFATPMSTELVEVEKVKELSNSAKIAKNENIMSDILKNLQKEVSEVEKLSLDNINFANIVIEVQDSQENASVLSKFEVSGNENCEVKRSKLSQNSGSLLFGLSNLSDSQKKEIATLDAKYSRESSNVEGSVIEILDSQEIYFMSKIRDQTKIPLEVDEEEILNTYSNLSKTKINETVKSPSIEIPDSQENVISDEKHDKILQVEENEIDKSPCIEIPDSQDHVMSDEKHRRVLEITENRKVKPSCIEIPDSQDVMEDEIHNGAERFLQDLVSDEKGGSVYPVGEMCNSSSTNVKGEDSIKIVGINSEVIEILDDNTTLQKTPSKQKIENFFKAEYIIKKTPKKSENEEEDEKIDQKIISPFFVKKTPGSSSRKKLLSKNDGSEKRVSKASKALFTTENANNKPTEEDIERKEIETESELLRTKKSKEELEALATKLDQEKFALEKEKNRQDRMGLTVTEKMKKDCMDLLKLFGIPYIVAPMEAEAQCAFLEAVELTHGTITDDSDIWLFGGRTVYKNFFDKQKHVLEFKIEQILRDYSLDREKLIQLAFLVGSDYTIGIKGIGTVTALEILAEFPNTPVVENETTRVMSILSSLRKFRDWFNNNKSGGGNDIKVKLKSKLKNVEISNGFPNLAVAEAYLHPNIDDSKEPFTWGSPNLEEIKKFARKYFGWTPTKTDETLRPVLKRLEQKQSQSSIKNFFNVKYSSFKQDIRLSKRVEKAVKKISINNGLDEDEVKTTKKTRLSKRENLNEKNQSLQAPISINKTVSNTKNYKKTLNRKRKPKAESEELVRPDGPSTVTKVFGESPDKKFKAEEEKKPCIPQTKQTIPQREQDIVEMNKRKELASTLFKRSRAAASKTKNI